MLKNLAQSSIVCIRKCKQKAKRFWTQCRAKCQMYYLFEVFHTISFLTSKLLKHINDTLEEQGSNANNVHKDYTASYQCWNRKCSRTNSWEYFQAILFIRPACLWSSKYFFYMQEKIFLYWLVSILSFQSCLFQPLNILNLSLFLQQQQISLLSWNEG